MFTNSLLFLSLLSSASATALPQSTTTSTNGTTPLGSQCTTSSDCVLGADCYAVNSGLITTCGNFQASCTTDSQCAYNTCVSGLCSGYLSSSFSSATTTSPSSTSTGETTVYLPLGAECNPKSTPCADESECWASNSGLIMRCGNFNAECTRDSQCAFNTCNTDSGLCSGFLATSTSSAVAEATTL